MENHPNKIALSAKQLASLDLLIAQKELNPHGKIEDDVADALGQIAAGAAEISAIAAGITQTEVAVASAAVAGVAAVSQAVTNLLGGRSTVEQEQELKEHISNVLNQVGKNMSLNSLIEIRRNAIERR